MFCSIEAKVIKMTDEKKGVSEKNGNPWVVREYLAEYQDGEFIRQFVFTTLGDNVTITIGQEHTLYLMVEAREWKGKYYNSIRCTKAYCAQPQESAAYAKDAPKAAPTPAPKPKEVKQEEPKKEVKQTNADDLPF